MRSDTPLYTDLAAFAARQPLRLHMPGHKGQPLPGLPDFPAEIDFTELPPTGDLYQRGGPVEEAEKLWAELWGADCCLFLTGGSTQGIHTALRCAAPGGGLVLADRVSHRSIHTGLALLGCPVAWMERDALPNDSALGPLTPARVEQALARWPRARAVVVTSPTYYGVLSDIPAIARVCHRHGAALVVDGAHGAHLPLLGENPYREADFTVVSAHKTLRAPGQTALLFANGCTLDELQAASMLFATSSPSYVMMAALDALRPWCQGEAAVRYRAAAEQVAALRRDYPALTAEDCPLDPCRLTLCVPDGEGLNRGLMERGIYPEMADRSHVVCILTEADGAESFARLREGLDALGLRGQARPDSPAPALPPLPEQVCPPRAALLAPAESVPWEAAPGRVAAEQLAPYPPGVPVVAPGERISKKVLAYLEEMGYNKQCISVLQETP
ncbi:MAG: aminotransferase class V-fold PLP-dependent enzyme [Clostridiales bacterium]|nr:aminotransferase class V-fold PLP-dependent enzyme [Clostridiales bacterium]